MSNIGPQLLALVERIETLESEKREIAGQIKDVYAEAKGNGFDTKALRKLVAERRKDAQQREEERTMLELYERALDELV